LGLSGRAFVKVLVARHYQQRRGARKRSNHCRLALADAIADALVQEASRRTPRALVGVEVAVYRNCAFITGRIACENADGIDLGATVRDVFLTAGFDLQSGLRRRVSSDAGCGTGRRGRIAKRPVEGGDVDLEHLRHLAG